MVQEGLVGGQRRSIVAKLSEISPALLVAARDGVLT